MKQKLNRIYTKTHELIVFLKEYTNYHNVHYFLDVLKNLEMTTLYYMDKEIFDDKAVRLELEHIYKSIFFPRDGLGDFYIMDSDRQIMREKNDYFSDLIEELDNLLK